MKTVSFTPTDLTLEPYPVASGRLTPGTEINAAPLWEREDGSEVGAVWEMTPGVLEEVQGNEAFVIVSGRARVEFPDGRVLDLGPGDGAFIAPNDPCRFVTLETVRKVVVFRLT
ncbi:cupin domain-containing protein [Nocardioides sp. CER19]|uniref:cupin domain-containing protein n=1 Tax=Nocardioides sp. CER19 TaxID=3038538 RepID=UPI00244C9700|nr:cupin domain-containing protein [Nocardioides sp. CER19]MDH2416161.1 cupin domain-containing protein [Nocardioides sp. CER19]